MDYKEKVIALLNSKELSKEQKEKLESIFPKLAESEDERIRKWIYQLLEELSNGENSSEKELMIIKAQDWLEKQGEQKPVVTPKFRIGDIITPKGKKEYYTIIGIVDGWYEFREKHVNGGIPIHYQFGWELVEQKPAWSEEDAYNLQCCIAKIQCDIDNGRIGRNRELLTWLKSIKDRVQSRQEWSEEDEQYLLVCKNALAKYQTTDKWDAHIISHWLENKLKSLRPQSHWKPSNEQMKALNTLLLYGEFTYVGQAPCLQFFIYILT